MLARNSGRDADTPVEVESGDPGGAGFADSDDAREGEGEAAQLRGCQDSLSGDGARARRADTSGAIGAQKFGGTRGGIAPPVVGVRIRFGRRRNDGDRL